MKFDIITLFPEFFNSVFDCSILKKAQEKKLISIGVHNLRQFGIGKHLSCDDTPYGGGSGMVLKIEPLVAALSQVGKKSKSQVVLLSPNGEKLTQKKLYELTKWDQLILVCGRYEGIDDRFRQRYVDQEISIGDYVLNGGETASLVLIEGVSRLIPGVIGSAESLTQEYPQYTRPQVFSGQKVPDILLSGDHKAITQWRERKVRERARVKKP